jgi:single-strand DNA-binding protein
MSDLNSVNLIGRLTRDAELKYTNGGTAVCKFAIAVNRKKKDGENWVDEASFFDIVLWGRQGEALNQYMVKGKQVGVKGELRQERWEQDGQKRSRIEVVAMDIQLLGGGNNSGGDQQGQGYRNGGNRGGDGYGNNGGGYRGGGQNSSSRSPREEPPREDPPPSDNEFTDDIPF